MKYSVIIPVYNTEKYIKQCLQSILDTQRRDLEILVINDGSTDKSGEICREIAQYYSNIHLFEKENGGQASARNIGIREAKGEYVIFLDSDDFWDSESFEKIDVFLSSKEPDLLLYSVYSYYGEDRSKEPFFQTPSMNLFRCCKNGKEALKEILKNNYTFGWCPVFYVIKRSILIDNEIFFPEGRLCEDVYFSFQLWMNVKKVCGIQEFLYYYRRNNTTSTTHISSFKFSNDLLDMISLNHNSIKGKIEDDEMRAYIKLNCLSLIEVVLFNFCSYSSEEKKILAKKIRLCLKQISFDSRDYYKAKTKEKLVLLLLRILGVNLTGFLWKIKKKIT